MSGSIDREKNDKGDVISQATVIELTDVIRLPPAELNGMFQAFCLKDEQLVFTSEAFGYVTRHIEELKPETKELLLECLAQPKRLTYNNARKVDVIPRKTAVKLFLQK